MLDPNYVISLFTIWMAGFPLAQVIVRWVDMRKAGAEYDLKGLTRMRDVEFWVWVGVGAALLALAVLVWIFGGKG